MKIKKSQIVLYEAVEIFVEREVFKCSVVIFEYQHTSITWLMKIWHSAT